MRYHPHTAISAEPLTIWEEVQVQEAVHQRQLQYQPHPCPEDAQQPVAHSQLSSMVRIQSRRTSLQALRQLHKRSQPFLMVLFNSTTILLQA